MLVVAAAVESGDIGAIQQASTLLGINPAALEEAERTGLIVVSDARLELRHPLVRSAVYHAAAPPERRAVHRAIAETCVAERDLDSRAYHLAAATFGPEESVAAALEQAAVRAGARGGYAAAAAALARAARLTPDEDERPARRLLAAADASWAAGDTAGTMRLVREALERGSDRPLRADGLRLKGYAEMQIGPVMSGHDTLVEAAAQIQRSNRQCRASDRALVSLLLVRGCRSGRLGDHLLIAENAEVSEHPMGEGGSTAPSRQERRHAG